MISHMMAEEIQKTEKLIRSSTFEWSMQMNHVREAFDSYIICIETRAKGETAESVSNYMEDVHKYLLNQFYSIFAEMSGRIKKYTQEFLKEYYDRDVSAEEIDKYDAVHLKTDFEMMEKMMDELEKLLGECRKTSTAKVECYQRRDIWKYGEVWKLEQLAKERENYLKNFPKTS